MPNKRKQEKSKKAKIISFFLLFLIVILSIIPLYQRLQVDNNRKTGFYIDYNTLKYISIIQAKTVQEVWDDLKNKGFIGIALMEENGANNTLFSGDAEILSARTIKSQYPSLAQFVEKDPLHVYMITPYRTVAENSCFVLKLNDINCEVNLANNLYLVKVQSPKESVKNLQLGYDLNAIYFAESNNIEVLYLTNLQTSMIDNIGQYIQYLKKIDKTSNSPMIAFIENKLPKESDLIARASINLNKALRSNGVSIGMEESIPQDITKKAIRTGHVNFFKYRYFVLDSSKATEVYSDMFTYSNSIKIGIRDRRTQAVVFYIPSTDIDKFVLSVFYDLINESYEKVRQNNYEFLPADKFFQDKNMPFIKILISIFVLIYFKLVFNELINNFGFSSIKTLYNLGIVFLVLLSIVSYSAFLKIIAFATAVGFVVNAVYSINFIEEHNNTLRIIFSVFKVSLIATIGGIVISAILSEPEFYIHADLFRGVKLYLLITLVASTIIVVYKIWADKTFDRIRYLINKNLTITTFSILATVVFIVWYFVIRSGNTGTEMMIPGEIYIRNFLETVLPIRPRFKEFAVGYPLLYFAIYYKEKDLLKILSAIGSVIVPISIVNTLMHQYGILYYHLLRISLGFVLGSILGLLFIYVFEKRFKNKISAISNSTT